MLRANGVPVTAAASLPQIRRLPAEYARCIFTCALDPQLHARGLLARSRKSQDAFPMVASRSRAIPADRLELAPIHDEHRGRQKVVLELPGMCVEHDRELPPSGFFRPFRRDRDSDARDGSALSSAGKGLCGSRQVRRDCSQGRSRKQACRQNIQKTLPCRQRREAASDHNSTLRRLLDHCRSRPLAAVAPSVRRPAPAPRTRPHPVPP